MKLYEILNRSNVDYRPATSRDLAETSAFLLKDAESISNLAGKYSLWKKSIAGYMHFYFIKAGDVIAGWVGLKPRKTSIGQVYVVDLIFFTENFRNTKAVPLFLHALRNELDSPVMIDADDAVFRGGSSLIDALVKRGAITLSALSPDGKKTPIRSLQDADRKDSILIEDSAPLSVPLRGLLGQQIGTHLIDWADDRDEFI